MNARLYRRRLTVVYYNFKITGKVDGFVTLVKKLTFNSNGTGKRKKHATD